MNNWYTYDQIDKALYRLKAKGAITAVKSGSRKLLITVCNYDKYQSRTESQKSGCRKPDSEEAEMSHSEHFEANSSDTKAEQTAGQDGEKTGAKNKELIIKKEYSEEQIKRFVAMQEWIWEHCPTVALMPQPFTIEQYLLIRKSYFPEHSSQRFMKILTDMEAWEGLEKRKSAYKTFLTFYKRSQESQSKPMFFIPKQPKMVI
ncbi:MAG TPA: hypothetical protein VGN63_14965 [Flavisolibacter sp.]|nr:hypothetical protein [Flavisolibacter sp.]